MEEPNNCAAEIAAQRAKAREAQKARSGSQHIW